MTSLHRVAMMQIDRRPLDESFSITCRSVSRENANNLTQFDVNLFKFGDAFIRAHDATDNAEKIPIRSSRIKRRNQQEKNNKFQQEASRKAASITSPDRYTCPINWLDLEGWPNLGNTSKSIRLKWEQGVARELKLNNGPRSPLLCGPNPTYNSSNHTFQSRLPT